jgi:hypothetical protein
MLQIQNRASGRRPRKQPDDAERKLWLTIDNILSLVDACNTALAAQAETVAELRAAQLEADSAREQTAAELTDLRSELAKLRTAQLEAFEAWERAAIVDLRTQMIDELRAAQLEADGARELAAVELGAQAETIAELRAAQLEADSARELAAAELGAQAETIAELRAAQLEADSAREQAAAELGAQAETIAELRAAQLEASEARDRAADMMRGQAETIAELRADIAAEVQRVIVVQEEHQLQIEALQDRSATAEEQIVAVDKRARSMLSQLPKKLMLDHEGNLVAIDGEGECSIIGPVCGRDGVDGVSIKSASIINGKFTVEFSDGRRVDVGEWPAASPAADPDAALAAVARALKADRVSETKIRALMGVSRPKLKRWLNADTASK